MRSHISCGHFQGVRAHRGSPRPASLITAEHVLDQPGAARIETHHRLVDQHRARAVEEGRAHHEALLHAVGEALDQLVLPAARARRGRASPWTRSLDAVAVHAVQAAVKAQELAGGELLVDERAVGDEAEGGLGRLGVVREVVPVRSTMRPDGGLQQPGDHADRRRLAGTVRTEEAVDLSRRHLDRHPSTALNAPNRLPDFLDAIIECERGLPERARTASAAAVPAWQGRSRERQSIRPRADETRVRGPRAQLDARAP